MAVNGVIPQTVFSLSSPGTDISAIKTAISKLETFSINVENCGYPAKCQDCQGCQACQTCQRCQSQCNCNCNCGGDSDG